MRKVLGEDGGRPQLAQLPRCSDLAAVCIRDIERIVDAVPRRTHGHSRDVDLVEGERVGEFVQKANGVLCVDPEGGVSIRDRVVNVYLDGIERSCLYRDLVQCLCHAPGQLAACFLVPPSVHQLQQRDQLLVIARPRARRCFVSHGSYGQDVDDLAPHVCGRCRRCCLIGDRFVGKDVAVLDAESVRKQQAADQREFARIVIADDRHAPVPVVQVCSMYLEQVVVVELVGQRGMQPDLHIREDDAVRWVHPGQVLADLGFRRRGWRFRVRVRTLAFEMCQVDGTDGCAVLFIAGDKVLACSLALEAQPPREVLKCLVVARQHVGLAVVHHLQVVLDRPQKDIAVFEHAVFVGAQESVRSQPAEGVQRRPTAKFGRLRHMGQLQVLGDELDVANRPLSKFHLSPRAPLLAQVALGPLSHGVYVVPRARRVRGKQKWLDLAQEGGTHLVVAGDDACLDQCLLFPHAGVSVEVGHVPRDRGDQRAAPSPRAQPHIYAVEKALRGSARQGIDQLFPKPGIVDCARRSEE